MYGIDRNHLAALADEAGFFTQFAQHGVIRVLSELDTASGQRPRASVGESGAIRASSTAPSGRTQNA